MVIVQPDRRPRSRAAAPETITGEKPTVVLSDDSGASTRIRVYRGL